MELWTAVVANLGVKLHQTTAYNPQAKGLQERYHRITVCIYHRKAALRVILVDGNWMDRQPWVLLGLHSAPKKDQPASAAELVLGQPLRVLGDFLSEASISTNYRPRIQDNANSFAPVHHCLRQLYIPRNLQMAGYVFIQHDAHRSPLRPSYDGPFRVMTAGLKSFLVDLGGRPEQFSIDRLKPVHLVPKEPVDLAQPP